MIIILQVHGNNAEGNSTYAPGMRQYSICVLVVVAMTSLLNTYVEATSFSDQDNRHRITTEEPSSSVDELVEMSSSSVEWREIKNSNSPPARRWHIGVAWRKKFMVVHGGKFYKLLRDIHNVLSYLYLSRFSLFLRVHI